MSSHPVSFPTGLTRGYSNAYIDTLIGMKSEKDSSSDILETQQAEGGR